jgi:hypothetical protein
MWGVKWMFILTMLIRIVWLFFLLESIVEQYGYSPSDLIYSRDLGKNLVEGLHLVSSDYDVAYDEC